MDVNRTRFHLLTGEQDWSPLLGVGGGSGLWWDEEHGALSLEPEVADWGARGGRPLMPTERRGAAVDRFGNRFWIGVDELHLLFCAGTAEESEPYWSVDALAGKAPRQHREGGFRPSASPETPRLPLLRGLTVTREHYLAVGTRQPGGLLLFDLHGGGPPAWLRWPAGIPFAPFDLSASADGGLWVLDRRGSRLWRLDRRFRVLSSGGTPGDDASGDREVFAPVSSERPGRGADSPRPMDIGFARQLEVVEPLAVEALSDGSVLVLVTPADGGASVLHYLREGRETVAIPLAGDLLEGMLDRPYVRIHDLAFRPAENTAGEVRGELAMVMEHGNQALSFGLSIERYGLRLHLRPRYLPLRRYSGKALVAGPEGFHYDIGDRWYPLTPQPRHRFVESGEIREIERDGKEPGCVWHRLLLDACIPEGASVEIETRAADRQTELADQPWTVQTAPYLRGEGSEIPFHRPFSEEELRFAGTGTWELLLRAAKGRYLQMRLRLRGDGRSTPRVRALRIYYPRFSYLTHYLPALYGDEPVAADFLERFLANPEGMLTSLEGRIAGAEALLDTRTAPPDYLPWLAGWLGATLDPGWDDRRRRLFLDHAELLFRWRGTPGGLLAAIRLAIDPCPDERLFAPLKGGPPLPLQGLGGRSVRIVEQFLLRETPGVVLGDPESPLGPALVAEDAAWAPEQGAEALHRRFRAFLEERYGAGEGDPGLPADFQNAWGGIFPSFGAIRFPPLPPEGEAAKEDWLRFTRERLGFVYAEVCSEHVSLYREFLARRYRRIETLNSKYERTGTRAWRDFQSIRLPPADGLPDAGPELRDWIQLVSRVLPMRESAHRFTVLVPTRPGELQDVRLQRLARVEAIVKRERPAHTDFDVRLFWALFRVGSARLGIDTLVGEGSRYVAVVLGSTYIGQGHLAHGHPWNVTERAVVGRGRPPMPLGGDPRNV